MAETNSDRFDSSRSNCVTRIRPVSCAVVIRFCPHRWLPLLGVLVLGLFALGLVLQSVLATAGAMHYELAHDSTGMHAHDLHAEDVDAELVAAGEQDEDGAKTLHVLLHFAHCCGGAAAVPPILNTIPAAALTGFLTIAITPIPLQARLTSPFRPPIFG